MNKKPQWAVEKERKAKEESKIWLFGLHAVRDALQNPARKKKKLLVTKNAFHKLQNDIGSTSYEVFDPHRFHPPIDKQSVHQGAVLEVEALSWGKIDAFAPQTGNDILIMLDRVSDPHNVGAILRSSEVLGARAVIAPHRHSAPETGALAKTASGALERQPYLRVNNLGEAMLTLKSLGYTIIGLDGEAEDRLETRCQMTKGPIVFVLGAEGPGMRQKTKSLCDFLVKIPFASDFGSLNVSNAAAIALHYGRLTRDDS